MMKIINRIVQWAFIGSLFLVSSGCNPVFFNQITAGGYAPLAPGDTPYVLAHVVNNTDYEITIVIGFDAPTWLDQPVPATFSMLSGSENGILLPCPVSRLKIGSLTDNSEEALSLTLTGGGNVAAPSSAFPITLEQGVDYSCGDAVIFTVINDRNSTYQVSVWPGVIPGEEQQGPFSGPDTFMNFDTFQQLSGSTISVVD